MENFLNEDFDRIRAMEDIYLMEKQREMEEEYYQWEEEQRKLPATIVVHQKTSPNEHREILHPDKTGIVA